MINNLSALLTDKLLAKGSITEDERELYIYGFFMLLSHIMYFVLACIFGILFKCFIESIIFYIAFQFIRRYAGGYHAATETRCEILSTLSIFVSTGIIKLSKIHDFKTILLIITLISVVIIFILCPLDTPEKPLSDKEFKYFRKISWIVLFIIVVAIIVTYCFNIEFVLLPCCMSLILESILLTSGKFQKNLKKRSKSI